MLLAISLLGILLSVILLYFNSREYKSSIFLGLFFLITALYGFSLYLIVYSRSVFLVSIMLNFTFIFYFIGPLLFWYVRSILNDDSRLRYSDIIHLLPVLIYFVFLVPFLFSSYTHKVEIAKAIVNDVGFLQSYKPTILSSVFSVHAIYISRPLFVLIYTFGAIGIFIRYLLDKRKGQIFRRQSFMIKWLVVFLGFQSVLVISHFIQMLYSFSEFFGLTLLQLVSGFAMMGLLISPFFFPGILYGLPRSPALMNNSKNQRNANRILPDEPKRQTHDFETDYLKLIEEKVDSCMNDFQPYLQHDFNLIQFSVLLNIPVHHLAYYFREVKKQSFIDYRNHWRINHAKTLIKEGKTSELTLEAIGLLSGFTTRNTFFTAFKKAEGYSPGAFASQFNRHT
jgi:AraC-like DNA-binding protein